MIANNSHRFAAVLALSLLLPTAAISADDSLDAKQLVEQSRITFERFLADPAMKPMNELLKQAKGVLIAPQILRGAFLLGASGGSGVFLARGKDGEGWSSPTFYTIGDVSFGLQIGGDSSETVLVAMTDRGVSALLTDSMKLGANAGVAMGPVGVGAAAATENLSADILTYSRSKGAYAGLSFDGAVVATRAGLNAAYYGKPVSPSDVLLRHEATNSDATPLVDAVARAAGQGSGEAPAQSTD